VIGGHGAFVATAQDYDDFVRAIRIKLLREISGTPVGDSGRGEPATERRADRGTNRTAQVF
jgi:hypothetical protein